VLFVCKSDKAPKIPLFRSPPPTCKKSEISGDGHKLEVGLHHSKPKSTFFSIWGQKKDKKDAALPCG